jgi:hypothetical protein
MNETGHIVLKEFLEMDTRNTSGLHRRLIILTPELKELVEALEKLSCMKLNMIADKIVDKAQTAAKG